MAFDPLTTDEVTSGKPVTTGLMTKIKNNLNDLDNRLGATDNRVVIWNKLLDVRDVPVGTTMWSFETETDFIKQMGSEWELVKKAGIGYTNFSGGTTTIDGASSYAYLANNAALPTPGTLGDVLAQATAQPAKGTVVTGTQSVNHTHAVADDDDPSSGSYTGAQHNINRVLSYSQGLRTGVESAGHTHSIGSGEWDDYTNPRSLKANLFVKTSARDFSRTRRMVYKASRNMEINTVNITQMVAGTAGSLEIDIQIGGTFGTLSSIFTTNPEVSYGSGDYADDEGAGFDGYSISTNDWIVLEIISVQETNTDFHIQLEADTV